ncbi:c-type cytochrome [Candidatus Endoriftia persephone]|nr:c-type cytochrome [Candidatus Endoriftia persephone]
MSRAALKMGRLVMAGALGVTLCASAWAEERADVRVRISPVGKVAVEGQAAPAAPAPAAAAAPKPAANAAPAAAAPAAAGSAGAALYAAKGCAGCHGADAKKTVMPVYPTLAGQSVAYLVAQMKDIKTGARHNGQAAVMKGVIAGVSDAEMQTIAEWLSGL